MQAAAILEHFADLTTDGIMVTTGMPLDEPGPTITYVNPAFTRMTGYTAAEAVGRSPRFLQGPETDRAELDRVRAALATCRSVQVELVNYRRDGSTFEMELAIHPYFGGTGACTHFIGILHDITARKRAERRLREREEFLRVLTDAVPGLVGYVDRNLVYRFHNSRITDWFGIPTSDLIGRRIDEFLGPALFELIREPVETVLAGQPVIFQTNFCYGSGSPRRQRVHYIPHRAADGTVLGFYFLAIDETERWQAEQALRAHEAEFRLIAEHSHDFIARCDRNAIFLYASPACQTLLGYRPEELVGRSRFEFVHADDVAGLKRGHEAVVSGAVHPSSGLQTYRFRRKDGSYCWLETRFTFLEFIPADHPSQIIAVSRDITESHAAAEALRVAKEVAEQANRAKTRFLAAASHDLRQPLNAMSLLLGVLRPRVTEQPQALAAVDQMRGSLDTMMELFNALLDISRFETGDIEVQRGPVDVRALLRRLEVDFATTAQAKGLKLRVVACHAVVWSDPTLLERIIRNLVSNAIRYTATGGILIGCRRRHPDFRIDVIDTGPGIPEEQRKAIFEEFHQLDTPGRSRGEGHGLGLAIVRRAADLLGHPIEIASVVNRGTRFSITLPCDPAAGST